MARTNRRAHTIAAQLATALGDNDTLTKLDLRGNSISDEGTASLAAAVRQRTALHVAHHVTAAYHSYPPRYRRVRCGSTRRSRTSSSSTTR